VSAIRSHRSRRVPPGDAVPGALGGHVSTPINGAGRSPSTFAPARAYIEQLLPDVIEGRIEPGRVFDRSDTLDDVPDGYRAMNEREAIKVMAEF
jgi:hypothetical protein